MIVVRFYVWIIKIGLSLAMLGQLKACTLTVMGLAADKSERGVISYSEFSRRLTGTAPTSSLEDKKARSPEKPRHPSP